MDQKQAKSPDDRDPPFDITSVFRLENIYEDSAQIFKPNRVEHASSSEVIIAVDTNVLLLPYTIRRDSLPALEHFYKKIKSEGRLYIPSRVAREFIGNRDKKLAELLKTISDVKSRINIGETRLAPILEGVEGSEQLGIASKALSLAKEQYTTAISLLEEKVRSWSGDDPVTTIYATVFDSSNMISPKQSNTDILNEWKLRLKEQIPPGYKDGAKADTGIGDFLIWKALLDLGEKEKKDLIFITGEEKADWFVRVNGGGAYPRPELVSEYQKFSGGKNIRLAGLHDVLREMALPREFVSEVELAEQTANIIVRANSALLEGSKLNSAIGGLTKNFSAVVNFRLRYGGEAVTFESSGVKFAFQLSERGKDSLWVYPNENGSFHKITGDDITGLTEVEHSSRKLKAFAVEKGEMIGVRDASGNILLTKMLSANQPEPKQQFEVSFAYSIYNSGDSAMMG